MKFKTVSDADVAKLREARKVLKKLKMRELKLNVIEDDTLLDKSKDWKKNALKHWQLLDELAALHINVDANGDMSLDAQ